MTISKPEISVEEVVKNLYIGTSDIKTIINNEIFINKLNEIENNFKNFTENDHQFRNINNFPKPSQIINIDSIDREINNDFMVKLYGERLRGAMWRKFFKPFFYPIGAADCVYCGSLHSPTLDHILPKSIYTELIIIPSNLVRCCSECNGKKKEFVSKNSFYYPYRAEPLYNYLKVTEVTIGEQQIDSQLVLINNEYKDTINKLNLKIKISDLIEEVLSETIKVMYKRFNNTADVAADIDIILEQIKTHRPVIMDRKYIHEAISMIENQDQALKSRLINMSDTS